MHSRALVSHTVVAAALLVALPSLSAGSEAVARQVAGPEDLLAGTAAAGQVGDFLLTNGEVTAIIEAVDHPHGAGLSGGNLIDLGVVPGFVDELHHSFTLLGAWPGQADYDTVGIEADGSGGEAVVLARGTDSENPALRVTTRYSLKPGERFVTIETEIENTGGSVVGYRAGDDITWGSGDNFVPGYGFGVAYQTTISDWLGSAGETTSYAYTQSSGAFQASHGATWSDPIVLWADVPGDGTVSYERYLVAGGLGLASASDVVHAIRGQATGTLEGAVTDEATSGPVAGATIDCAVNGIAPYTQILSDALGHYGASLPRAGYSIEADAVGYYGEDGSASVALGDTTTVDFVLRPEGWAPPKGDTLTVVMRPILSVPEIVTPGGSFTIEAMASPLTTGWAASLRRGSRAYPLTITGTAYVSDHERWFLNARAPSAIPAEMYDLVVTGSGGVADTVGHSVAVEQTIDDDFYFIHITDTHLPTHLFLGDPGADADTTEMEDLRAVIEDINIINPAFVLHTGDLVNEGELEDYLGWRVYTRTARILSELDVPVFLVPGNHDIGGWSSTPPPPGSSRWAWWSFFGWRYLYAPPPLDSYTQDVSFDYGGAHFVGMEAYDNYDNWRPGIYGAESFTPSQMQWLANEIASVDPSVPTIAFYHYDFGNEINLATLGIDCALWGHIHSSTGSTTARPFDLSLATVADGGRMMRLVRVSGGQIYPSVPISAGQDGGKLGVSYDPANDGTAATVTATIVNRHPQSFENALVRFYVPADSMPYAATNGELLQTLVDGAVATCYVRVNVPLQSTTYVSVEPTAGPADTLGGRAALLRQSAPNPARTGATIGFVLAGALDTTLEIFDVAGRRVVTLIHGLTAEGPGTATWDLKNEDGLDVASGIYFYRLKAGGESITKKLVVVR